MSRNLYLSVIKTPFFVAQEYFHRIPDPTFNWSFSPTRADVDVGKAVSRLKEDGLVQFPAYFNGKFLASLKRVFDALMAERSEGGCGNPNAEYCENILDFDSTLLEAALDSTLLEVTGRYYGKKFAIGRADALRIFPVESCRYGSFQWHHDGRGRQIKAQILLTDLEPDGQCMTYVKGSHKSYYTHGRGKHQGSRFERDITNGPNPSEGVVNVAGPAGTVILFDTNGLHSGNRNNSATRDTLTIYYSTGGNFKPLHYRRVHLAGLPQEKRRVLLQNPRHELID